MTGKGVTGDARSGDFRASPWHASASRLVNEWVTMIGLDRSASGIHSLRRANLPLVYRRTLMFYALRARGAAFRRVRFFTLTV